MFAAESAPMATRAPIARQVSERAAPAPLPYACAGGQRNRKMPGFGIINFTLPASLAGAGDVPVQVQFLRGGLTTVSRPAATAPRITIN